ncbi:DUF2085 domain-containing protein [Methanobrevibacter wolinii]|uniref:DUF2085 domain-containing protein n=1 Tax=Methanobrevibacter wolinii TaxID=190977 RepID=UPI0005B253FD|nr:DUF2085 domain-containing protein [Methanobrevibacter wolinii]MDD5959467.1 DUF2085 domain-containing protein [Methanobrevibacter wolinii]
MSFNPLNLICHRRPDRTFSYKGHYFPVCARCTGFYISIFAYFIYAYFVFINYTPLLMFIGIFLLVPAGIDGFTQFLGWRESTNYLRLITGLLGGIGLAIIIKGLKYYIYLGLI